MIPQMTEHREKLLKYIEQNVNLLHEIDTLKEDIKNISEMVKEELSVAPKDFNLMVKVAFDKSKIEGEIETRQTAISNVEILKGV